MSDNDNHRIIAENLRYDDTPGRPTKGGLYALQQFCLNHHELAAPYKEWKRAYDALKQAAAQSKLDDFPSSDMKILIQFSDAGNEQGRKAITNQIANSFLGDFQRNYAPSMLAVLQDRALENAANKVTKFWQRFVSDLSAMTKTTDYAQYAMPLERISHLSEQPTFAYAIASGMAKGESFRTDPQKLEVALGANPASFPLARLDLTLAGMGDIARSKGQSANEKKLRTMQEEFRMQVRPALAEYTQITQQIEERQATAGCVRL